MLCNLGSVSHSTLRLFIIREHLVFIFVPRKHSAGHREGAEGLLAERVSELHRCLSAWSVSEAESPCMACPPVSLGCCILHLHAMNSSSLYLQNGLCNFLGS